MRVLDGFRETGPTPYRQTIVTYDHPDRVTREQAFLMERRGRDLRPDEIDGVIQLASGCWVLKPVNDFDQIHERTDAHDYIMRLSEFAASPLIEEVPTQRKYTELVGISALAGVDLFGDQFFTRSVPAGQTWDQPLSLEANAIPPITASYPLDPVMRSTALDEANTGYLLRLFVPGAGLQTPDVIFGFGFGGPVLGADSMAAHTGYGQFHLQLTGDGQAFLWEFIDNDWTQVNHWYYNQPRDTPVAGIILRIIPHSPNFIEVYSSAVGHTGNVISYLAQLFQPELHPGGFGAFLHACKNRTDPMFFDRGTLKEITGPGHVTIAVRRDLRMVWQVSRLGYPNLGTLRDGPFLLQPNVGNKHVIQVIQHTFDQFNAMTHAPLSFVGQFVQGFDGAVWNTLPTDTEHYTWGGLDVAETGWVPPGGQNACRACFQFQNLQPIGKQYQTPNFYGYQIRRNPDIFTYTPPGGQKTINPHLFQRCSITGPGPQPDHENATLVVEDAANELATLRRTGRTSFRIETTYDPAFPTETAILFEGYLGRPTSRLQGKRGAIYPSPDWHEIEFSLLGKWARISHFHFQESVNYSDNGTTPRNRAMPELATHEPWKVTDFIRDIFYRLGFDDDQLDIPDQAIILYPGAGGEEVTKLLQVPAGAYYVEVLETLARDWLNAYVLWDANAGTQGKWRVIPVPQGTETPVWHFVTTPPAAGARSPIRSAAYAPNTSPILRWGAGGLQFYTVAPESNLVVVSGGFEQEMSGNLSTTGAGIRPRRFERTLPEEVALSLDPPDPLDHLGYLDPLHIPEQAADQNTVDFIARRQFTIAAHGHLFAEFPCELVLIDAAAADPDQYPVHKRRPLRAADLVTIDGALYVVHAANMIWHKDHAQGMHVEAELLRPGITVPQ